MLIMLIQMNLTNIITLEKLQIILNLSQSWNKASHY